MHGIQPCQDLNVSLVPRLVGLLGVSKSLRGERKPQQGEVRTKLNKNQGTEMNRLNEPSAQDLVVKVKLGEGVRTEQDKGGDKRRKAKAL